MDKQRAYDELVVEALVLQHFGKCPDLGTGELRAKVTYCALGECAEREEAEKRIKDIENANQPAKEE